MKTVVPAVLSFFFLSACTPNSELEGAKKTIAELKSELANEKAKNKTNPSATASAAEPKTTIASKPDIASAMGPQWIYDQAEDKMSGGTTFHARVQSSNTVEFSFPYAGVQHATLHLRIDPKFGKDVIFRIEKGQILCNSYQDCTVLVRFDDEQPVKYSAIGAADNSTETIFIRNYGKFVEKLLKAKQIRISTNIYQQGAPVFEFDVGGFKRDKFKPAK